MTGRTSGPEPIASNSAPFLVDPADPAFAGQAAYTPRLLRVYDTLVVRLSNDYVWRCPAARIVDHYSRHIATPHLDVGPGTGFYLDRCRMPPGARLTLLDANPNVLAHASRRLARFHLHLHGANALRPIDLPVKSFGSVGLSYLLHCLPGTIAEKSRVFDHVLPLTKPGGIIFGATILAGPDLHNGLGRRLMNLYNAKGIFANARDDLAGLEREIGNRFEEFDIEVVGAVALFACLVPAESASKEQLDAHH